MHFPKKTIVVLLFLSITVSVKSQRNQNEDNKLTIHGVFTENKKDKTDSIYIIPIGSDEDSIIGKRLVGGKYTFHIQTSSLTQITLFIHNPNDPNAYKNKNMLTILTRPGKILLHSQDSLANTLTEKSKTNLEFEKLQKGQRDFFNELTNLYNSLSVVEKKEDSASVNMLRSRIDSTKNRLKLFYRNYIINNRSSLILPYCLSEFSTYASIQDLPFIDSVYKDLPAFDKGSYFARKVRKTVATFELKVGNRAPVFSQADTSGKIVSLNSFKGKYILVDFWASWCVPCRKANPHLSEIYNKFKNKNFTIISISLDKKEDRKAWIDAIKKDGLTWTNLSELNYWENSAAKLYSVYTIPQNFLIDPDGKIIAKKLDNYQLEDLLSKIL